jgi:hypothetical protein
MNHSYRRRSTWAHLRNTGVAALSAAALALSGCGGSSSSDGPIEANIDELVVQIGGATTAVEYYNAGEGGEWTLYSMANRFAAAPVGMVADDVKAAVREITVTGFIQNITVVTGYGDKSYALLSMGSKGIAVVDITDPGAMVQLSTMTVPYTAPEVTTVDGGGNVVVLPETPSDSGTVNDLLVDDRNTEETTDDQLYIANGDFGIQRTKLSNLIGAASGVLVMEDDDDANTAPAQFYTLVYAGENPWGGPLSLKMQDNRLYAALGFVGMGIFNPSDLSLVGKYNLYADCTYRGAGGVQEDWFGYPERKIACPGDAVDTADIAPGGVGTDGLGEDMPTYQQAAYELKNKDGLGWYPWAEFDRYGKYYYNARTMDVQVIGANTIAYIAYGLGGLVAVDVTDPAAPVYQGYVPAAPAHGPDEPPINVDSKGILSHFGSGMLKEAGVMDVRVVPDPTTAGKFRAYFTDHFAGMVVVEGAEDPALEWKNPGAPFDNDCLPDGSGGCTFEPRVFWPDYEFVTSYDMTPVPVGDESLPKFLTATNGNYAAPVLLVTGEINGHGGALFLLTSRNEGAAGQVDAVQASGAGGVSYVDVINLTGSNIPVASRFDVPVNLVSTNEVGAFEDGTAGQPIAIGHTEGVTVSGNFLYVADGPHGVSAWRIADGRTPIDAIHLVANTLQSEYPTGAVMPTPHAFKVGFGDDLSKAYVMSQSLGMRRVDVSAVLNGTAQVGAPAILDAAGGIFEHNTEAGAIGLVKVEGQDHAYGVTFSSKYAIVADGDNGLTVYDTTAVAGTDASVVANIGDSQGSSGKPPVGRASSVKLWTDSATGKTYAVVAAGAYGVSVVDMTDFLATGDGTKLTIANLIKTFEPLKSDDDNAFGSADGRSVDVHVVGDVAYFSYDSFGIVAYRMADLIRPATEEEPLVVPDGQLPGACAAVTDVTKLSAKQGGVAECRPTAVGYFKLQFVPGNEDVSGGALYMTPQLFPGGRLLFYVAYGEAGVLKLDWSNIAAPTIMARKEVVGGAVGTAINNGRVYVAAGGGGVSVFK